MSVARRRRPIRSASGERIVPIWVLLGSGPAFPNPPLGCLELALHIRQTLPTSLRSEVIRVCAGCAKNQGPFADRAMSEATYVHACATLAIIANRSEQWGLDLSPSANTNQTMRMVTTAVSREMMLSPRWQQPWLLEGAANGNDHNMPRLPHPLDLDTWT